MIYVKCIDCNYLKENNCTQEKIKKYNDMQNMTSRQLKANRYCYHFYKKGDEEK